MTSGEASFGELLKRAYLCPDRRSLAVGRICIGLVLLGDLGRYVGEFDLWFGRDAVLGARSPASAAALIAFAALVDVALVLGLWTRLVHALALGALLALHARVPIILNAGDRMLRTILFWTLFLPLGDYFSLDARRRGHRPDRGWPSASSPLAQPTIAYAVLLLQLAVAYLVNGMRKTDRIWVDGLALAQFFHDPALTNTVGCALQRAPLGVLKIFTHFARFIEFVAPFLILSPIYARRARHLAIFLLLGLHVGIIATLNVGVFSWVMMAYYPMLLVEEDWVFLERLAVRLGLQPTAKAVAAPPRLPERVRRGIRYGSEAVVAVFALACIEDGIIENLHLRRDLAPAFARALVSATGIGQRWGLFTGEHPFIHTIVVDAETAEGRHVDPLNEIGAPAATEPRPWSRVPGCLNMSTFVQMYTLHFPETRDVHEALGAWILRYPERTHREGDRIVSYQVYHVEQSVDPRSDDPPEVERTLLMRGSGSRR